MNVLAAATRLSDDAKAVYKQTREKEGGTTSAVRAKRMELAHFLKIRESMRKMSRAAAMEWLDDWLVAGINTGLRPGEWPLAHLEIRRGARHGQRRIWLHVVNDKATNGRANGTFRTLDISSYRNETLEAIGRMIARSLEWAKAGETSQRQTDCAQLFNQLCNKLFQRMTIKYSLYSLRHQFIANMKTVINDDAQVATLIGHISVGTQLEHYSKRRAAWSRFDIVDVPVPIDDQVQQVRKHLTTMKDRELAKSQRRQKKTPGQTGARSNSSARRPASDPRFRIAGRPSNKCDVAVSCPHSIFAKRLECCADQLSSPPNSDIRRQSVFPFSVPYFLSPLGERKL
jgi:hypothetical protein